MTISCRWCDGSTDRGLMREIPGRPKVPPVFSSLGGCSFEIWRNPPSVRKNASVRRQGGVTRAGPSRSLSPCVLGRRVFSVSLISTSRLGAQLGECSRGASATDRTRVRDGTRDVSARRAAEEASLPHTRARGENSVSRVRDPADFHAARELGERTTREATVQLAARP